METALPHGEQNSLNQEVVNFDKVIEQSQAALQDAAPIKRGRGRPRKNPAPTGATQPENGPKVTLNDDFKDVGAEVISPHEVEPLALEFTKAPFDLIGIRSGIDITPTDVEAKLPSYYLAKLIHSYLPDLDLKNPRKFNLIAWALTSALLAVKKIRVFAQKKRELYQPKSPQNDAAETEVSTETSPQSPPNTVSAASHLNSFGGRFR